MRTGSLRHRILTHLPLALLSLGLAACGSDSERRTDPSGQDSRSLSITSTPNKQDWKQCENGRDLASSCDWVTGNLNATQNIYREGDVVPHILRISTISGTSPISVVMTYGFKKGGKSTYDFLAPFNKTMVNANPCNDSGFSAFCTSGALKPIDKVSAPIAAPSNLTGTDVAAYAAAMANYGAANVTISGIGMDALSVGAPVLDDPTGADVEATVTITFTPKPGTTEALLLVGSHVARGKDWANGGASSVPGSPYHLGLITVDGKVAGSMDLQMASNAIIPDTKLTLVKHIVNDDGGTATLTSFPLTATGPTPITGVSGTAAVTGATVLPGAYALSEATVAGYTASAWVCAGTGGTQNGSTITLVEGGDVTCTITNTDNKGSLQVIKRVINDNGGTATVASFALLSSAGALTFDGGVADGAGVTKYSSQVMPVAAGSYTLRESDIAGYTEGTWSCTGGTVTNATISAGAVTVPFNGTVVCTITNDDSQGTLQLVKRVVNDNGGTATVSAFSLSTTAGALTFDGGAADGASTVKYTSLAIAVNAGSYTLREVVAAGYAPGTWSCTGGTVTDATIANGAVTVPASGTVVCTITNNDIAGSLQIVKRVVNDNGGTATVTAFNLNTTAGALTFGGGVADGANTLAYSSQVLPVNAGSYTLRENDIAGYAEGTWSCVGAPATNSSISAGAVTVPLGMAVVCTITNNDDTGSLTIVKRVVNDNGGTAAAAAFGLATSATPTLTFGGGTADGANTLRYASQAITVNAGSYTLTESDVAGYTEGSWSCTGGGTVTNTAFNAGAVTVPAASSVVCTITNNDIAGTLQVVKRVVNDNGGAATVSTFGVISSAGALVFGSGVADGANTLKYSSTVLTVNAGSYTLRESDAAGYTEGTWSCTGATPSPTAYNTGAVTVPLAGAVVCSITNDDQPARIIIEKQVKGINTTFDFTTTGTGFAGTKSITTVNGVGTSATTNLLPGSYTVTELVKADYTLTDLKCTEVGGTANTSVNVATGVASITLEQGETVTCQYVNTGLLTTRTQGFWATHLSILNIAWFGGTAGGITTTGVANKTVCGKDLDTIEKVLGGFWSSIAQTTANTRRSSLDQARMNLTQQLLGAIANHSMFGASPATGISIDQARAACLSTNIADVRAAHAAMAAFNESGDSGAFTPGASAQAKAAKSSAFLAFWDAF